MNRFFVPPENINRRRSKILVNKGEAHHIIDVMRMGETDKVVVFDGTGNEYTGFIEKINRRAKTVIVEIVKTEKPPPEKLPEIYLAQAVPKKNKMDYIVEKATELGVHHIIPFISQRTIVRPDRSGRGQKVLRWRRIAKETAKQCGRKDIPSVSEITGYEDISDTLHRYDVALLACMSDDAIPINKSLAGFRSGRIMVLIGPEGDFTPEEIDRSRRDNCKAVSLGQRVLKSDTAGLFVLSILGYEFS